MNYREFKPRTIVRISWVDSSFKEGWHYPDKSGSYPTLPNPRVLRLEGAGIVVESTQEALVLALSMSREGGVINPTAIPWGAVQEVEELLVCSLN